MKPTLFRLANLLVILTMLLPLAVGRAQAPEPAATEPALLQITGVITGPAGKPLAGVDVVLSPSLFTVTDANGVYRFADVKPADYSVTPVARGYLFTPAAQPVGLSAASQSLNFSAEIDAAYALPARPSMVSAADAVPLEARFAATSLDKFAPTTITFSNLFAGEYQAALWSFGDGAYSTEVNPVHTYAAPGVYEVTLTLVGAAGQSSLTQAVTVSPSSLLDTNPIYLPVLRTAVGLTFQVSGQVTDAQGTPIAGVTIKAGIYTALTGADGRYNLTGLPDGTYTLEVTKSGYTCSPLNRQVNVPPAETSQNFTCGTQSFSVNGQVLSHDGSPLAGVTVYDDAGHSAVSNASGDFTISGLPAGSYTFTPSEDAFPFTPSALTVQVGPSAPDITFIALAAPWLPQPLGVTGDISAEFPTGSRSLQVSQTGYPHIAFGGVSLNYAYNDGSLWYFYTVDAAANVGAFASLALDSADEPHIAYYDIAGGNLKYAEGRWNSGVLSWTITEVDATNDVGKYASLVLDSHDRPHIAYFDESNDRTKYAYYDGDDWILEVVDSTTNTGAYTSLALNGYDIPRIAYYDIINGDLRYAIRTAVNTWAKMTVTSTGDVGLYATLVLDSGSYPYIAYFDETNDELRLTHFDGYSWSTEIVDSDASGAHISMAIDNHDNPHLSYYDLSRADLKYAHEASGGWQVQAVDTVGDVGKYSSIALDDLGAPHFLYYSADLADLLYVTVNKWEYQTIGAPGALLQPGNRNLQIDSQGNPHFAYGSSTLVHAYFDGSVWIFETVDGGPSVGGYVSLVLGADDVPQIAYYDSANGDLKHAKYDPATATWILSVVDSTNNVGLFTSIALDASGSAHIAYFDETNDNLMYARWNGTFWNTETVEKDGSVGLYPSIALNAAGIPRISYLKFDTEDLRYAIRTADNEWSAMTVASTGAVGYYSSLALDKYGLPHISYFDDDKDDLHYAYYNGYNWTYTAVDTLSVVGGYSSLIVDQDARPHISYYDVSFGNLKYATWDGYDWIIEIVDGPNDVGKFSSLALDPGGDPRFLYYDETDDVWRFANLNEWQIVTVQFTPAPVLPGNRILALDASGFPHMVYGGVALYYASFDGAAWTVETVDSASTTGGYASLALDDLGFANISYYDVTDQDLKFARQRADLTWSISTVDSTGDTGLFTSIAIDSSRQVHIAYFNETDDDLKYAFYNGATWTLETVDSTGDVGAYAAIALNGAGIPRISYMDLTNEDLRYAVRVGANNWSRVTVLSAGDIGYYTSLEIDSHGFPHIAYFDDDNDDLKYVYWDGAYWHNLTVDSPGSVGRYASLRLDAYNRPHITYQEFVLGNLKYAYWDGVRWVIETVENAGNIGVYTSLTLDNAGLPHIAYGDASNGRMKYARGLD